MSRNDGVNFPQASTPTFDPLNNSNHHHHLSTDNVHYSSTTTFAPTPAASKSTPNSPSSSTSEVKVKKHQPKYRATKRPSSERRFQCDQCESLYHNYCESFFSQKPCFVGRFFTQKDVKRHMVVHTGLRNFACPYCTHRFGRKDHLVRHTKKSHNQDTRSLRRINRSTSVEPKKAKKENRCNKKSESPASLAAIQSNSFATASTSNTTSNSSNMISNNNNNSHSNNEYNQSLTTTSFESYNPVTILSTSTMNNNHSNTFTKLPPVDNVSTSTFTAHQANSRNYHQTNLDSSPYSNLCYNPSDNSFSPFISEASANHYTLQHPAYFPYDGSYKVSTGAMARYPTPPAAAAQAVLPTWPVPTTEANNNSNHYKQITTTITTSIVEGFNPTLGSEYHSLPSNSNTGSTFPPALITNPTITDHHSSSNYQFHSL